MSSRRIALNILATILSGILVIVVITILSLSNQPKTSSFTRSFSNYSVNLSKVSKIDNSVIGIGGSYKEYVFFQTKDPTRVLKLDSNLGSPTYLTLDITSTPRLKSNFSLIVNYPTVYIIGNNVPLLYSYDLSKKYSVSYNFPSTSFSRSVLISPRLFLFRALDPSLNTRDQAFFKGNPFSKIIIKGKNISEELNDGGMSTDGSLTYDSVNKLAVYVYFYRDEFICLDTNLSVKCRHQTIDRSPYYQARYETLASGSRQLNTSASPVRIVNMHCYTSNGLLYVNSSVKSANESKESFSSNSVIDVYSLSDGIYKGSFYIPTHENEKMKRFKIFNNKIVVLYNNYAAIFNVTHLFD